MKKTGASARKVRMVVIDDHPMMRQGLAQLIANEPDLELAGEAGDAGEGLEKVRAIKPDLALVDITLPGKSGLELIKDLHVEFPNLAILVLSMHDESLYAERVLRAGARGYIMKQEGGRRIMAAVRQVLSGKIYVSDNISARIVEVFSTGRKQEADSPVATLTDRELEVFELIGKGLDTKEIATRLNVSAKTVEVHRTHLKSKLKVRTLAQLIREAVRWSETPH